jgi:thymidylate synthase ThyX
VVEKPEAGRYTSNEDGDIYALSNLPEEVIAVLFARYSRSPGSLRENLAKVLEEGEEAPEKAAAFHERWVLGFGHKSVAEQAVAHLAVENVSMLAAKAIEDCRLASYTEKSSRYVRFDPQAVYPGELDGKAAWVYREAIEGLAAAYEEIVTDLVPLFMADHAAERGERSEATWRTVCTAQVCDMARGLLPVASYTNLGMTVNARELAHMIGKLLASPLPEIRRVGRELHAEGKKVLPTLLKDKYTVASEYRMLNRALLETEGLKLREPAPEFETAAAWHVTPGIRMLQGPTSELGMIFDLAAAFLYEQRPELSFEELRSFHLPAVGRDRVQLLVQSMLDRRGPFDAVPRAFEYIPLKLEIVCDYGAWRDLQRHRMTTQTVQLLTSSLGYEIPEGIVQYGYHRLWRGAAEQAAQAYEAIAREVSPEVAQYLLPLCYRVRALVGLNLREFFALAELRSGRQGHMDYRRIAWAMADWLQSFSPVIGGYLRIDREQYTLTRPG